MIHIPVRTFLIIVGIALLIGAMRPYNGWTQGENLPLQHPPEEGEDLRRCTECHDTEAHAFPFRRFEHTPLFGEKHRLAAVGSQRVCAICHPASFCADCHRPSTGLKPSIKNHGDTRRRMPHRGDYLTRHRIDGRFNPGKCFRCHGRPKAAAICKKCHG